MQGGCRLVAKSLSRLWERRPLRESWKERGPRRHLHLRGRDWPAAPQGADPGATESFPLLGGSRSHWTAGPVAGRKLPVEEKGRQVELSWEHSRLTQADSERSILPSHRGSRSRKPGADTCFRRLMRGPRRGRAGASLEAVWGRRSRDSEPHDPVPL